MDHKAARAALPAARKAALTERSDRAGITHLAGPLGLIALCALPIALGWPGWWIAVLPLGILTVLRRPCSTASLELPALVPSSVNLPVRQKI